MRKVSTCDATFLLEVPTFSAVVVQKVLTTSRCSCRTWRWRWLPCKCWVCQFPQEKLALGCTGLGPKFWLGRQVGAREIFLDPLFLLQGFFIFLPVTFMLKVSTCSGSRSSSTRCSCRTWRGRWVLGSDGFASFPRKNWYLVELGRAQTFRLGRQVGAREFFLDLLSVLQDFVNFHPAAFMQEFSTCGWSRLSLAADLDVAERDHPHAEPRELRPGGWPPPPMSQPRRNADEGIDDDVDSPDKTLGLWEIPEVIKYERRRRD